MKTCIIMAAHNEAENIAAALESCGSIPVFVVDDASTDDTLKIAKRYTGNVLHVNRGGKGKALRDLLAAYKILDRYEAFITLDADSILAPGAVKAFESALKPGVAGAVGYMRNITRNPISMWRSIQYLQVRYFWREGMAALNCIHVMCGTCAIWQSSAFKSVDMRDNPVEDMLYTYELHRKRLGRIAFARKALVFTQEPQTFRDYFKQMLRWLRGYWGVTREYNTPFGWQMLDLGQLILFIEFALATARLLALPFLIAWPTGLDKVLLASFGFDILIILACGVITAVSYRNWHYLAFLWLFPLMYVLDTMLNLYSFLTYRKLTSGIWVSPKRKEA